MNKIKSIILLFIILLLPLFFLTGCSEDTSIENLAYVIAIGIDKGEHNLLKLSLQFATPESASSGSGSSGSTSESTITTADCSSIDSGINLINSYISKKINLSHCKVVVFSEELAADGIGDEIYTLINNIQMRPDCNVIVSKCDASDFLNNSKPVLVNLVARYYEIVLSSGEYSGYSYAIKLNDFYCDLKDSCTQPVAILGGINTDSTHYVDPNANYIDIDGSYKAGEALVKDKNNLEILGLAVFNQDKLVGELNGLQTLSYLLIKGKLQDCIINIPDPLTQDSMISLSLKQSKNPKIKVNMVNNSPLINIDIYLSADIASLSGNADYTSSQNIDIINSYANSYLEAHINEYLYKTSKDFKSDINGFGRKLLPHYARLQDFEQLHWLENYKNAFFIVNVHTTVKGSSVIFKN